MSSSCHLMMLRHGQTTWNAIRRMQGQSDSPLSDLGKEQARSLEEPLKTYKFTSITSSDLSRARDTAALAGLSPVEQDSIWREISVGLWSGRTYADLQVENAEAIQAWFLGQFTPPEAESWAAFCHRIDKAIKLIRAKGPGLHLVIAHGLVIKAANCLISGAHHNQICGPSNCSTALFELNNEKPDRMLHYNQALGPRTLGQSDLLSMAY